MTISKMINPLPSAFLKQTPKIILAKRVNPNLTFKVQDRMNSIQIANLLDPIARVATFSNYPPSPIRQPASTPPTAGGGASRARARSFGSRA